MFTTKHEQPPALMLGFASCNAAELRRGVSVLATALRSR
jgi:GntR family transcriptional regulator/MocR family aminotransferase